MVYKLVAVIKSPSGKISSYKLKNLSTGIYDKYTSTGVKNLIVYNNIVQGVHIKNGRLYLDSDFDIADSRKQKQWYTLNTGSNLVKILKSTFDYKYVPRDFVKDIIKFCKGTEQDSLRQVLLLHGVRRTGKTVAIEQSMIWLINNGINPNDIAYITVESSNAEASELYNLIESLNARFIFVDECTRAKDFIEVSSMFADHLTHNKRIVLTGTDSFVFPVAKLDRLYGRTVTIKTTYLTFKEYIKLFSNKLNGLSKEQLIKSYMTFGGVMLDTEYNSLVGSYNTLNSTVIENIRHTINSNTEIIKHHPQLKPLTELNNSQMMYSIFNSVITCMRASSDNTEAKQRVAVTDEIRSLLNMIVDSKGQKLNLSKNIGLGITPNQSGAVKDALTELDIIKPIRNFGNVIGNDDIEPNTYREYCCMISGLYSSLIEALKNVRAGELSSELSGVVLENFVISQCVMWSEAWNEQHRSRFLPRQYVEVGYLRYNYKGQTPEIDMMLNVILEDSAKRIGVEIKSSKTSSSKHGRNFRNESIPLVIGKLAKNIVVYLGETCKLGSIDYVNVYDFLMDLDKWILE